MTIVIVDQCINCKEELAPWERNRAVCLLCQESTNEVYEDGVEEVESVKGG
ncbi:hypothetical protein [Ammoniphilus sp. 3BR4]|uniref:hypothetical protein n=1 Tax=Ammoniphilus sp. 3BR4 TaxID=3158265 RepID=UPI0034650DB5